jgi:hypothetical protein
MPELSSARNFSTFSMAGFKHKLRERRKGPNESSNGKELEARGGIEPPIKVLQTYALPLGDRADCLWQMRIITSEARDDVSKIRIMLIYQPTGCAEQECWEGTNR